jgi:hypothetical protein
MSKIAGVLAVIFGCLGIFFCTYFIAVQPSDILTFFSVLALSFFCTVLGLLLAIILFIPKNRPVVLNVTSFLVNIVSIIMFIYIIHQIVCPQIRRSRRSANMAEVTISLELYKKDHSGELPDGSNWSDVLADRLANEGPAFISKDKAQWNYALNANAQKLFEVPDDMVVIFESGPGWNLVGGKELLMFDNDKGGCFILFGNMFARYVLPEDFDSLRWD